jgi:hypothetical protein
MRPSEGAFGVALVTPDHAHGLGFWGNDYEFGPLFDATGFGETEATACTVPIADDEPTWMALPAPLRAV